jgi:hypothetical protein
MNHKFIETWSDFILNETLKTHDIDLTLYNVNNELSLLRLNFNIQKNPNNSLLLTLNVFNYINSLGDYLDIINRLFIDRHGWFPTKMEITNFSGIINTFSYDEKILRSEDSKYYTTVKITYESKYDIEKILPDNLYHLSIQEYEDNVLEKVLIPKSKSKLSVHLDRIYVCSDIKDCYNLINRMKFHHKNRKINNKKDNLNDKWIIYEINTSGLDIKLYKDPNYINGYYIIDNIPSDLIKIIDKELESLHPHQYTSNLK